MWMICFQRVCCQHEVTDAKVSSLIGCFLHSYDDVCLLQDMTTLSYLNEPGVLWNLKCRYVLDTIYTYTGSIIIAVNPFQRLPHLYGPHMMEQYRGRALGELDPHVYAIADSAYRQMRTEGKSQSILVRRSPAIKQQVQNTCYKHFREQEKLRKVLGERMHT